MSGVGEEFAGAKELRVETGLGCSSDRAFAVTYGGAMRNQPPRSSVAAQNSIVLAGSPSDVQPAMTSSHALRGI